MLMSKGEDQMASLPIMAEQPKKRRIKRSKQPPKLVVVEGGKKLPDEDASDFLHSVSDRMRARQALRRIDRAGRDNHTSPERRSVAIAMLAVEHRLVKAFWTIARQPTKSIAPLLSGRCGIDYIPDRSDLSGYADAAGGKWHSVAPRPPIPSGKEIDAAAEALDWLLFVDEGKRKLLVAGATSKRGDLGRQINWGRLRQGMPELAGLTTRTCQGRYREALRIIVNELTIARLAK